MADAEGTDPKVDAANPDKGNQGADKGADTQKVETGDKTTDKGSTVETSGADPFTELEADTRDWLTKRDIKDAKAAAKLAHEQSKLLGSAIRVPAKDATPEEVDAFLNKLGRPEAPDKYDLKVPATMPEELPYDSERATQFKALAHKAGLTQAQAQVIHDWAAENAVGDFNTSKEANTARMVETAKSETSKLVKLWGPLDGDTMKANMAYADKALTMAFPAATLETFKRVGLIGEGGGNKIIQDADLAIGLSNIGRALYKEDVILRGDPSKLNNPFAEGTESFNLTAAMRMVRENPQEAMAFIAAAGKKPQDFGLTA